MALDTLILGSGSYPPSGKPNAVTTSVKTIAPTGRIGVELECVKCAHDLRGVAIAARCPECGEPVSSTLAARTLDNIDYARGGLEDYGGSLKLASLALIGILLVPVLGPLASVVLAGAAFVRVSATGRVLRSGLSRASALGRLVRVAHLAAWPVAVWASISSFAILHDAIGRWGVWLSPDLARAIVLIWILMVAIEVGIGIALVRSAARVLEIAWFDALLRGAVIALVVGASMQVLLMFIPGAGSGALLILMQVLVSWIPLIVGVWLIGSLVQRLGTVANELHWMCETGSGPPD